MGRAALLAQLDQLLVDEPGDRWVVVTGGPGMGKSALLAQWLARREAAGDHVPHHFIRRGEYDWDDPAKLAGSLVAQLVARFPDQAEPETDVRMHPAARLHAALQRVSQHVLVLRGERLIVLIDGLDEYDPPVASPARSPGRDPLADFLPSSLPRGVSLLCASRPRHPYVDLLAARGALQLDLDAPAFATDNTATVRAFWEQVASELGLDAAFVTHAVERADGNPQHAEMLRRQLAGMPPEQRRVDDIPRGLLALIARAWERIAIEPAVVDGLGILCAAREPLTLDELGRVAGWTSAAPRQAFVRCAREWLIETRRSNRVSEYRLHHDAIRGYIAEVVGTAVIVRHHGALAERLATWPAHPDATARRYALRHALLHRAEAGAWAGAWRVAADMVFLEAKCREVGVHEAEADVARAAAQCRASGDEVHGQRFADLARALGRESHWLRAAPEGTMALVWNRLRRYGWTAGHLDVQLRVTAAADFLRVRHVATCESPALIRSLERHMSFVTACVVTAAGQHVVSASEDQTLKVWELGSGRAVATLKGIHGLRACAVTPDGRYVVSASAHPTLEVRELASGRGVAILEGHYRGVNACVVTPDGRHVISGSEDATLKVWELGSWRTVATLEGHAGAINACAVTPDGRHVVSASEDRTLKVWQLGSGNVVATLGGHTLVVTACAVTPDGRHVVSASEDRTLRVWELASGRAVAALEGHTLVVTACAVTPDGQYVVSASEDKTLQVWDLASGRAVATLAGHTSGVRSCAITPDGRHVVSASKDQTLKVWELGHGRSVAPPEGHTRAVTACAVTPDGWHAASASADRTLKVWELRRGCAVATLEGHALGVTACTVTPDGRYVVSASSDRTLKIWDLRRGHAVCTLAGHASGVAACAVTPDGRYVISVSEDGTLRVWELESGRVVGRLAGHTERVTACAVMPDSRHVVSASADRTLKVWELGSGHVVATLVGHTDLVTACAVTPDGRHVVSASVDRTLKVWELGSGRAVATLAGHTAVATACAMTPDGRHVVSASYDQTLKVWDLATYNCRITHRGDARYLAVAVSATTIMAGDAAGIVWFLDLPPAVRSVHQSAQQPPGRQPRRPRRHPRKRSPPP